MLRRAGVLAAALVILTTGAFGSACAQAPDEPDAASPDADESNPQLTASLKGLWSDVTAYYTAPVHWSGRSWAYFGGALAAVGLAHHFDSDVRSHFAQGSGISATGKDPNEISDALPAAGLLLGTWAYAEMVDDDDARTVAHSMLEAATLASATGFALKFLAGRERPNQTTDPNRWRAGGSSFPSLHLTAAYAVGTVFAESGEGGYLWMTRVLGYGLAAFTGYQRLKHNGHWLSDVVAGTALGTATGAFMVERTYHLGALSGLTVVPLDRGVLIAYHKRLR